jgi:hypothetical protein
VHAARAGGGVVLHHLGAPRAARQGHHTLYFYQLTISSLSAHYQLIIGLKLPCCQLETYA